MFFSRIKFTDMMNLLAVDDTLKRNMINIWLLLFLLGSVSSSVCAQPRVDSLEHRLKILEDYKSNIQQLYTINAKQLETYIDKQIVVKTKDIEEQKKILNLLLVVGVPGTLVGLLVAYFAAI